MKLHLLSAYDTHPALDQLVEHATLDRAGNHELTSSPDDADAIVFVENGQFDDYLYQGLLQHSLIHRYPDRVFMYNEVDKPSPVLPGLYCSIPDMAFKPEHQIAFAYLKTPNPFVSQISQWQLERHWLYTFVGSATHRCRMDVLELGQFCDAVQDTSEFDPWNDEELDRLSQELKFARHLARSHYALCPRSIGTSSRRLFEAMQAGVAPVIISDHWVPTPHIDWTFAVHVAEKDINTIPKLLESMVDQAGDRGRAARTAWESVYAPDTIFNTAAESIAHLLEMKDSTIRGTIRSWHGVGKHKLSSSPEPHKVAEQRRRRLQSEIVA